MPAVVTYNPTGNAHIDGILGNVKWAVNSFSYSFPTSGSYYGSSYGSGENVTNFEALNTTQQTTVRSAFNMFASVANLSFTEVKETSYQHADLRFAMSDVPGTAWAYFPTAAAVGGDSWFNNSGKYYDKPAPGNYASLTFIHEIGHALGLEHAHEGTTMPLARDSMEYTVMSYRSYAGASTAVSYANETWGYAQSLMMYDIAALQHMYGANYASNGGNTTYVWNPSSGEMLVNGSGQGAPGGNRIFQTVWDGGGSDTYDFSNYGTSLTIDLRPGEWSTVSTTQLAKLHWDGSKTATGNIANALLHKGDTRSLIENAVGGSGNDVLTGNQAGNSLKGGSGNDRLTGGAGSDVLDGGVGSDTAAFSGQRSHYNIKQLSNGSVEIADVRAGAPDGTDTVWSIEWFQFVDALYSLTELGTGTLSKTSTVIDTEPQGLYLSGTSSSNKLYGGAGDDKLYGQGGNDILVGGAGRDLLSGGSGSDTASYSTATAGVYVDLASPSKNRGDAYGDSYSSIGNLTGSSHADNLRGNSASNTIKGGGGSDTLYGRSGNDKLYGFSGSDKLYGGNGRDILTGGSGADTFIFKSARESRGSSTDTIKDFRRGSDHIDLRGIDADTTAGGNQAFSFIGKTGFSGKAGQLRFDDGVLSGDVNGDGAADFQVKVSKLSVLSKGDFYL